MPSVFLWTECAAFSGATSQLSIPFATILTTEGGIIEDYKVYADVSPL